MPFPLHHAIFQGCMCSLPSSTRRTMCINIVIQRFYYEHVIFAMVAPDYTGIIVFLD